MLKHVLFDWGNTLMVDNPLQRGAMCDWPDVKVVGGAVECLARLSQNVPCHLATNAQDSTERQIRAALTRGGLSGFIQQVFCFDTLGMDKSADAYYDAIVRRLQCSPHEVAMIGDSLERDVRPALASGLRAIWFNPLAKPVPPGIQAISSLTRLFEEGL